MSALAQELHRLSPMSTSLDIVFRGMDPSPAVEGAIQRWVARLQSACGQIHHCSVTIEQPHHHHRRGNLFHVRVHLAVPGRDIAVSREPAHGSEHEDVYIALGDVFRAARRQLQEYAQISRGEVKQLIA